MLFKCVRAHIRKKDDLWGNAGRGKDSQDRVRRPWITPGDPKTVISQPKFDAACTLSAGILEKSMRARNRVGIGLS
jgi:hypothetical protein